MRRRRLDPISAELTYGLERIASFLQDNDSIYDIMSARDPENARVTTYGDVRLVDELQFSVYNFELADVEKAWKQFELCEGECKTLLEKYAAFASEKNDGVGRDKQRFPLLAAYDLCLKCSHLFNILDARGAISVTERVGVIARVRALAVGIAKDFVDQQRADPAPDSEEVVAGKAKGKKQRKLRPRRRKYCHPERSGNFAREVSAQSKDPYDRRCRFIGLLRLRESARKRANSLRSG